MKNIVLGCNDFNNAPLNFCILQGKYFVHLTYKKSPSKEVQCTDFLFHLKSLCQRKLLIHTSTIFTYIEISTWNETF